MGIQNERLTSLIERVERLEEEKAGLQGDIKEVYAEAKSAGYEPKVMRILIRERKMDRADFQEQQALLDVYREALGGFRDTALGKAGEKFVASIPAGGSVTISGGDTEVTIAKDKDGKVRRGALS